MKYASVGRAGRAAFFAAALVIIPVPSLAQKPMGFEFNIALSPKAAQRLATAGEGITIGALFYGAPNKKGEKHANEIGNIDLGYEKISVRGKETAVQITGKSVKAKMLKFIDGPAMVNVNVFSSRKTSDDNILNCDLIEGRVRSVQAKKITVYCSLIEENRPMQTIP